MTKKKLHETVLEICEEHKASIELTNALSELTIPKVGGSSDVNDYTIFDTEGNTIYIYCNTHKKWEPVSVETETEDGESEVNNLFRAEEKAKNGYWRDCNEGIAQNKEKVKIFNASKNAIMQEVLDEVITGSEAKEALTALSVAKDELTPREDGLGTEERPEA